MLPQDQRAADLGTGPELVPQSHDGGRGGSKHISACALQYEEKETPAALNASLFDQNPWLHKPHVDPGPCACYVPLTCRVMKQLVKTESMCHAKEWCATRELDWAGRKVNSRAVDETPPSLPFQSANTTGSQLGDSHAGDFQRPREPNCVSCHLTAFLLQPHPLGHCKYDNKATTGPQPYEMGQQFLKSSTACVRAVFLFLEREIFMVLVGSASSHANPNLLIIDPSSFRISFSTKLGRWIFMWLPV